MQTSEDTPNTPKVTSKLGWFTLFYAISLVGFLGGRQGLWYWYVAQRRPDWAIPGWGFTAVWTLLYGLLAAGSWNVWKAGPSAKRSWAIAFIFASLALNGIWPWVIFTGHQYIGSWVLAAIAGVASLVATITAWTNRPAAGAVWLIQFLWNVYLTLLSLAIWLQNR